MSYYQKNSKLITHAATQYTTINCILIYNKIIKNIILNVGNIDNILIDSNNVNERHVKPDSFYLIHKSELINFFEDNNFYVINVYCKNATKVDKLYSINNVTNYNTYSDDSILNNLNLDDTQNAYIFVLKKYENDTISWYNLNINDWNKVQKIFNINDAILSIDKINDKLHISNSHTKSKLLYTGKTTKKSINKTNKNDNVDEIENMGDDISDTEENSDNDSTDIYDDLSEETEDDENDLDDPFDKLSESEENDEDEVDDIDESDPIEENDESDDSSELVEAEETSILSYKKDKKESQIVIKKNKTNISNSIKIDTKNDNKLENELELELYISSDDDD